MRAIEARQSDLVIADGGGEVANVGVPDGSQSAMGDRLIEQDPGFRLAVQFDQGVDLRAQRAVPLNRGRLRAVLRS